MSQMRVKHAVTYLQMKINYQFKKHVTVRPENSEIQKILSVCFTFNETKIRCQTFFSVLYLSLDL